MKILPTRCRAHLLLTLLASVSPPSARADEGPGNAAVTIEDYYQLFQHAREAGIASKMTVSLDAAPAIITKVTREDMLRRGYRSVADVLRDVPGLYVIDDLTTANVGVRGIHGGIASWSRVIKVLINGLPATFEALGGPLMGLSLIPLCSVSSVEIIRGPASALYGANAFLGAVNILTEDAAPSPSDWTAELGLAQGKKQAGGMGCLRWSEAAAGKGKAASLLLSFSGYFEDRSGMRLVNDSPRSKEFEGMSSQDDFSRPRSAFLLSEYPTDVWGKLSLQASFQRLDAFQEFGDSSVLSHRTRLVMTNLGAGLAHDYSALERRLRWRTYVFGSWGEDGPQQRLVPENEPRFYLRERSTHAITSSSEAVLKLSIFSLVGGIDYLSSDHEGDSIWVDALDEQSQLRKRTWTQSPTQLHYTNAGYYLQLSGEPLETLSATVGLRYDDASGWKSNYSKRAAISYRVRNNLSLKALYGTSFVPPAVVQLTASPVRLHDSLKGNPDLSAQRADTYELGISFRPATWLSTALNVFYTAVEDRVEFAASEYYIQARNQTKSQSVGGELMIQAALKPFFFELDYSTNANEIEKLEGPPRWWKAAYDSEQGVPYGLPGFPRHSLLFLTSFGFPKLHFEGNISVRAYSARNTSVFNSMPPGSAYQLPAYATLDVYLRTVELTLPHVGKAVVGIDLRNLLDSQYSDAGALGVDIPSIGRAVYLRLKLSN